MLESNEGKNKIKIANIPLRTDCDPIEEKSKIIDPMKKITTIPDAMVDRYTHSVSKNTAPETPRNKVKAKRKVNQGINEAKAETK